MDDEEFGLGGDDIVADPVIETTPSVVGDPVVETSPVDVEAAPVETQTVPVLPVLAEVEEKAPTDVEAVASETTEVAEISEAQAFRLAEIEKRRARAERFGIPFKEPPAAAPKKDDNQEKEGTNKERKLQAKKEKRDALAAQKAKEVCFISIFLFCEYCFWLHYPRIRDVCTGGIEES